VGRLSRIVGTPFSMWGGSPEPPVREADTLRGKNQGHAFNERSMSLCGVSDKEKRGAGEPPHMNRNYAPLSIPPALLQNYGFPVAGSAFSIRTRNSLINFLS